MKNSGTASSPVVSSSLLASGAMPALSEFEFASMMISHAFNRWIVRCMAAAGVPDLSPTDVMVLHSAVHRDRPKRMADICLMLNIEDSHIVSYSVKKLSRLNLVTSERKGKEKVVAATDEGRNVCHRYQEIRETLLVDSVVAMGLDQVALSRIAAQMRVLSGHYDQAARSAASL